MRSKSKLVQAINMQPDETARFLDDKSPRVASVLYDVLFHGHTYEVAGKYCGITKCAIYDHLIRIYKEKYGVEYAKREI